MTKVAAGHALGRMTRPAPKAAVAASMYLKGQSFIGAAVLLHRADRSEHADYVSLHLMCQGVELMLKGVLLLKDFNHWQPKLKGLGHNLTKLVEEAGKAYGQNTLRGEVFRAEFEYLARQFGDHSLRYAGLHDIFIAPESIQRAAFARRIRAFMTLVERGMKGSAIWTPSRVF